MPKKPAGTADFLGASFLHSALAIDGLKANTASTKTTILIFMTPLLLKR